MFYDFNTDTIKEFLCYGRKEGQAVPARDYPWHRNRIEGPWRKGIKPLDIVQPEGPSFTVDGYNVSWLVSGAGPAGLGCRAQQPGRTGLALLASGLGHCAG